jgi:hypothetical protein
LVGILEMLSTPPSKRIDKSADSSECWGGFIWVDSKESWELKISDGSDGLLRGLEYYKKFSEFEISVGSDKFWEPFSDEISEFSTELSSE